VAALTIVFGGVWNETVSWSPAGTFPPLTIGAIMKPFLVEGPPIEQSWFGAQLPKAPPYIQPFGVKNMSVPAYRPVSGSAQAQTV
jgi:hypothetical protein